jgi:hypothetical protein
MRKTDIERLMKKTEIERETEKQRFREKNR